jgi:hypothetical protein
MSRHPRPRLLFLERLEGRDVPATFGVPWPDSAHITVSFASDGTADVTGVGSTLFSSLGTRLTAPTWQTAILQALQTWAVQADINIGLVGDGGLPLSTPGPPQGDSRFGDIRVSAEPLGPTALAVTAPFDIFGSRAGDITFNSAVPFVAGQQRVGYDLFTVALHEAGHSLGLDDSTDPASAMYSAYNGVKTGLTPTDVANLRALYGARPADRSESENGSNGDSQGGSGNSTPSSATGLGSKSQVVSADLTTPTDVDYYKFTLPSPPAGNQTSAARFTLHTSGVSLLVGRLTVTDTSGNVLAAAQESDPLSGDISVSVSGPAGMTVYVRLDSPRGDVFNVGAYQLQIDNGQQAPPPPRDSSTGAVLIAPDYGTNDTIGTATQLNGRSAYANAVFDYTLRSSINQVGDTDFYRLKSPKSASPTENLVAMVWGLEQNGLSPTLTIYNSQGQALTGQVLVRTNGACTFQLTGLASNQWYYAQVSARTPAGHNTGNYQLGLDFRPDAVALPAAGVGTATAVQPTALQTLQMPASGLMHLVLGVGNAPASAALQLQIFDPANNLVTVLTANSGDSASIDVQLAAGVYHLRYVAAAGSGTPSLAFSLNATVRTDPIGITATGTSLSGPGSGGSVGFGTVTYSNVSSSTYSGGTTWW